MICAGSGSPTVLIEAGASAFAIDFALVQPEIAKTTRVCSYDRAGSGWSDARPDVETPPRVVEDLGRALQAAGEKPPYVIASLSADQYRSIQPTAPVAIAPRQPQTGTPFDRLPPPLYEKRVALDRKLVVEAIRDVVQAVRDNKPLQ